MQISAKTDYAVRTLLILAAHDPQLVRVDTIVRDQELPIEFIRTIINDLRRAGLVRSQRGANGGYSLARPPSEITIGDIFRAIDGPLLEVHGRYPHEAHYSGAAAHLPEVWIAVEDTLHQLLANTSLANVLAGPAPSRSA